MVDLILMGLMVAYAISDQHIPEFDIRIPRFFLVYVALGFTAVSALYGFWEFKSMFLVYQTFEVQPDRTEKKVRVMQRYST